jgi:hypothetical protein
MSARAANRLIRFQTTEANASRSEKSAPKMAATQYGDEHAKLRRVLTNRGVSSRARVTSNKAKSAPMDLIPSSAMLTIPLRSENMPPECDEQQGNSKQQRCAEKYRDRIFMISLPRFLRDSQEQSRS